MKIYIIKFYLRLVLINSNRTTFRLPRFFLFIIYINPFTIYCLFIVELFSYAIHPFSLKYFAHFNEIFNFDFAINYGILYFLLHGYRERRSIHGCVILIRYIIKIFVRTARLIATWNTDNDNTSHLLFKTFFVR